MLLEIGTLKYGSNSYNKVGHMSYDKKDKKNMNMVDAPTLTRSTTQRHSKFTFPIALGYIFPDLVKKGLLNFWIK